MSSQTIAIFGEVLFDQFPDGQVLLGGAPFNVVWHLTALGANPCFISRVGNDDLGHSICEAMQYWGIATNQLQIDHQHPTGTVTVSIHQGEPEYAILDQQAYDFIDTKQLDHNPDYAIIYHGTLAMRHAISAEALDNLIASTDCKIFIDVNLRAPWWHLETVERLLQKANWVKLNQQELKELSPKNGTVTTLMQWFISHYQLDLLIVTLGNQGAIALNNKDEWVKVAPEQELNVIDTVGAGDAFAAIILLGLQQNWSLEKIMCRAQEFASASVTQQGAISKDTDFYQPFITDWLLNTTIE